MVATTKENKKIAKDVEFENETYWPYAKWDIEDGFNRLESIRDRAAQNCAFRTDRRNTTYRKYKAACVILLMLINLTLAAAFVVFVNIGISHLMYNNFTEQTVTTKLIFWGFAIGVCIIGYIMYKYIKLEIMSHYKIETEEEFNDLISVYWPIPEDERREREEKINIKIERRHF